MLKYKILPAVNQIEFHPYCLTTYLPALLPLCRKHQILIAAFGPLVPLVRRPNGPVDEAVDIVIGSRGRHETRAQILVMWSQAVGGGVVVT